MQIPEEKIPLPLDWFPEWPDSARRELLHSYRPFISRIARRFGVPAIELDDVIQSTLMRLCERQTSFDPNKGNVLSWAATITRFVILENYRKRRRPQEELPNDVAVEDNFTRIAARELLEMVKERASIALSETRMDASVIRIGLYAVFHPEEKAAAIACLFHVEPSVVSQAKLRVRKQIKSVLEDTK